MIVLVGESASGKSSVEIYLMNNYGFKKIVSYTTRSPRLGEVDGIDYHFVSVEEFTKLKEQGFFAETAVYNNWHYGTAKEDCTDDKIAVLTPHGLRQISKIDGITAISFYINVPRRDRLIKILQRGDDIEEAYRRSLSDVGQFDGIEDEVDYVINNEGYKKSIEEMSREVMKKVEDKVKECEHEWVVKNFEINNDDMIFHCICNKCKSTKVEPMSVLFKAMQ